MKMKKEKMIEKITETAREQIEEYSSFYAMQNIPFNRVICERTAQGTISFHLVDDPSLDRNGNPLEEEPKKEEEEDYE